MRTAPTTPGLAAGSGPGQDLGAYRAGLRATIGCTDAAAMRLSEAERAGCNERLGRGIDPNRVLPAPIAPEKRAWFDAVVAARKDPGRPPGFGCALLFGGGKVIKPRGPSHAIKFGPLPCYVMLPKGPLTEEVDLEPPSRSQPDQPHYQALPKVDQATSGPNPPR